MKLIGVLVFIIFIIIIDFIYDGVTYVYDGVTGNAIPQLVETAKLSVFGHDDLLGTVDENIDRVKKANRENKIGFLMSHVSDTEYTFSDLRKETTLDLYIRFTENDKEYKVIFKRCVYSNYIIADNKVPLDHCDWVFDNKKKYGKVNYRVANDQLFKFLETI